jgi:hypothetical protein
MRSKSCSEMVKQGFKLGVLLLILAAFGSSQDLEPRAYSSSPTGLNFLVFGFGYSTGSVLFDPTLPIANVEAKFNLPSAGYGRTFGLLGRQSLVTVGLPYLWGNVSGDVFEKHRSTRRSGLADLRVKLSVNLHGNPARSPAEFSKQRKRAFIVGTSIIVSAPTGQYDSTKLINIGTNRWAFKPELGISYPLKRRLDLDLYIGSWIFTDNNEYFPRDKVRQQSPVLSLQSHVSYTFRPRLWIAGDVTWYRGGASRVDHGTAVGEQDNSRAGVTLSAPIASTQALKFAYSSGTSGRIGADFRTFSIAWQFSWFDH